MTDRQNKRTKSDSETKYSDPTNLGSPGLPKAEFDGLADQYYEQHKSNIGLSGESPEYFASYKIVDLRRIIDTLNIEVSSILDFGSGIGNSIPHFRMHFPDTHIICGDVSQRSIEIARARFPGAERHVLIPADAIPLPDASVDIAFTACVFHHIPHELHAHWLKELKRVVRPGGVITIFEHNPYNPLTVRAVNTCPLDMNARLIPAREMKRRMEDAGWHMPEIRYRIFFPGFAAPLRPLEKYLQRFFIGAQYFIVARG